MTTITIPKKMAQRGDLIIIPRKKYEELLDASKRVRRIKIKSELDQGLDKALREVREGKTFGPFETVEEGIKFLKGGKVQ